MPTLPIVTEPNPILRKKAEIIKNPLFSAVQELIPKLTETMIQEDGIGIAAPQVGESIQMIIINQKDRPLVMINPKILTKSIRTEIAEEGCLSVPGIFGMVKRSKKVKVNALDSSGKQFTIKAEGLLARVMQHEIDHLNGILFIDKMVKKTRDPEEDNIL
ncbi:MAG: peptide deformylase [Patescibacteria group bacterium]|jgi:peptide deformylase